MAKEFFIKKVVNSNKPEEEYVLFEAGDDNVSLSGHALIDNTFDDEHKSNIHRHVFIFPNVEIEAGDYVRVYTGVGAIKSVRNKAKTQTHYFYIGSDECIWNDKNQDSAILWKFNEIDRMSVPKK